MEATTRRRPLAAIARAAGRHRRASLVVLLLLAVAAAWAWWATQLWGLPDIGDPFDVAAFEAGGEIPDGRNAFAEYRRATSMVHATRQRFPGANLRAMPRDWAGAGQPWRDHLAAQREALALWRVGTEKPEGRHDHAEGLSFHTGLDLNQRLLPAARLAILEGSRLEAEGDMAGAWGWYRAAFRSSRHTGQHGFLIERAIGARIHEDAAGPATRWAADPRVDVPLLRRALDDLIAVDAMTAPLSDVLKMEYLVFRNSLGDPQLVEDLLIQKGQWEVKDWSDGLPVPAGVKAPIQAARLIAADDRERSLRVLRLMLANWLPQVDKSPSRRPTPASREPLVYPIEPGAPADRNPLAPEALARWIDSGLLARRIASFQAHYTRPIDRERIRQARLTVHLADQLYRREHGRAPGSPQGLVGPCLKALPEGFDAIEPPSEDQGP